MASNYALLLVPTKGYGNESGTMVKVESRHVSKVPGTKSEEVVYDTTLDPKSYPDHVALAGDLARLIAMGKEYQMAKDRIRLCVNYLDGFLTDLKVSHMPSLTFETVDTLFEAAIKRVQDIGDAIGYKIEHEGV